MEARTPLADITSTPPEVVAIDGTDVPVNVIDAVRRVGSRVEVRLYDGRTLTEDLDSDGLTEHSLLLAAIDHWGLEEGTHKGVYATYRDDDEAEDGWWTVARYPKPVGLKEVADMLPAVDRNKLDVWHHRGKLPPPRWPSVGGRPAWDAQRDILPWAIEHGLLPENDEGPPQH